MSKRYITFRSDKQIKEDLKELKKVNNILNKFRRTGREFYYDEVINIIKTTNNVLTFDEILLNLFMDFYLDDDNNDLLVEIYNHNILNIGDNNGKTNY